MPLSISRKVGEAVVLTVRGFAPIVVEIGDYKRGNEVNVLIDAPDEVTIERKELVGVRNTRTGPTRRRATQCNVEANARPADTRKAVTR